MKKILFIAIVAVAVLASCKKDRTCTCTDSSTEPGYTSTTFVTTFTKAKKGDARAACLSYSQTYTVTGGTSYVETTTCSLK